MPLEVVYLLIPTSNHNKSDTFGYFIIVVYLLIPTSNHNNQGDVAVQTKLYIF